MPHLTYSKTPPEEPGWYWVRLHGNFVTIKEVYVPEGYPVDTWRNTEWAGPIPKPEQEA